MTTSRVDHNKVSPWAVFDDNGSSLLVVNAYDSARPAALFQNRQDALAAIGLLPNRASPGVDQARAQLFQMSVLRTYAARPLPSPHVSESKGERLFLNKACLSVDVERAWGPLAGSFLTACVAMGKHARISAEVRDCDWGENGLDFIDAINHQLKSGSDSLQVSWTLRLSHVQLDRLAPALDRHPDVRVLIEDASEVQKDIQQADLQRSVEQLTKYGNVVRPVLVTRCGERLLASVAEWQTATDRAGVAIEPFVFSARSDLTAEVMATDKDFETAFEYIADAGRLLETSIAQSDPWSALLANVAAPGVIRANWSKIRSGAHLDRVGKWARSREHAAASLYEADWQEMFSAGQVAKAQRRVSVRVKDGPQCSLCPFAPLCDGYWSPQIDVLLRIGEIERASRLANLACLIRKDVLSAVLAELRDECSASVTRGKHHATFANGQLSITRRVHK